jgi:dienelactone hydrolase
VSTERVTFTADGITLVGNLALAADGAPAVVLTGPFTGVKEQVVGTYAARLHERGLTTLAFDHRGFGESDGRRAHEDSQGKLVDLRAAVGLLTAHPVVDPARVAALGICLGGGYAVRAAAADPRIHAVVGIAGAYNSPVRFSADDADGYRRALTSFIERYDDELPAVTPDGGAAAMGGDKSRRRRQRRDLMQLMGWKDTEMTHRYGRSAAQERAVLYAARHGFGEPRIR